MREYTKRQQEAAQLELKAAREAKELAETLNNKLDGWQFRIHDEKEYDRLFSIACILKTKMATLRTSAMEQGVKA